MRARKTLICDLAQQVDTGKFNLLGVFDIFNVTKLPANLPAFFVYTEIEPEGDEELEPGNTTIGITVNEQEGKELAKVEVVLPADKPIPLPEFGGKVGLKLNFQFGGVKVEKQGRHSLVISVNGKDASDVPFIVKVINAQAAP